MTLTAATTVSLSADDSAECWSGADPLSIPYEIRMQQCVKGNLAPNPSFERRSLSSEGTEPEGWRKVGTRVEWVDRESGSVEDEVREGSRAVKIHRQAAGELDEA